jgi:hypothetical protein
MRSRLLGIALRIDLLLNSTGELRDDVVLVFNDLLLADEEEAGLEDVEEETEVNNGLTNTVVGELGATLEHLVDTVGVSQSVGEEEAAGQQDDALLILLHDLGAERDDVGHKSIVVLLRKTVQPQARVDD